MNFFRAAAAAAVLLSLVVAPMLAQQNRSDMSAPRAPAALQSDEIPDAIVHKVGTALRNVTAINQTYERRSKSVETQQQVQDLDTQTRNGMLKAISDQGLSVQQYRQALQRAQTNSALRQRLISAAEQSDRIEHLITGGAGGRDSSQGRAHRVGCLDAMPDDLVR